MIFTDKNFTSGRFLLAGLLAGYYQVVPLWVKIFPYVYSIMGDALLYYRCLRVARKAQLTLTMSTHGNSIEIDTHFPSFLDMWYDTWPDQ